MKRPVQFFGKNCIIILLTFNGIKSQTSFNQLSEPEKKWAIAHPIIALKIKSKIKFSNKVVETVKREKLLDEYESGGKLDAFRHVFSMAYLAQTINGRKLKSLGIAHEKGNQIEFLEGKLEHGELPDSVSCQMDLRNNELGIELGKKFRDLDLETLKRQIIEEIKFGNAWIIWRNEKGNYLKCNGEILILSEAEHKWKIPKCLVKSNK